MVETRGDRAVMLLIHGLWFGPSVWTPWLQELDRTKYVRMPAASPQPRPQRARLAEVRAGTAIQSMRN